MDPITIGLLSGVLSNAVTAIFAGAARRTARDERNTRTIASLLESDATIGKILRDANAGLSTSPPGQHSMASCNIFMESPQVDSITRQLLASKLAPDGKRQGNEIRQEMTLAVAVHMGLSADDAKRIGGILLTALSSACDRAIAIAAESGAVPALAEISAERHQVILGELASIRRSIETLRDSPIDIEAIREFEGKYRTQVAARHAYITPPHFDAARKVPIDRIYVSADVVRTQKGESVTLTRDAFVAQLYRAVILGNPGGGKSTLAQKVAYDIATRDDSRLVAGRHLTPVIVVLRDYGSQKKLTRCSILQFVEVVARSNYQVEPPPNAFAHLLAAGHLLFIFDGLDELLDTSYREEISADIESFCNLYPSVPTLVTSREVGYSQAPLDERQFTVFSLSPFTEVQVREYARKWFGADSELTADQATAKVAAFMAESEVVSDLRANPLMLALMCNIYRGENYIPRNRPEVYEKCAVMLFERWDKGRGILIPLPIEAHINPAMKYLAHWIYSTESLQSGVSEYQLIAKASEYLCRWRFEDRVEAEKAAAEFIEFCRGRAWVFTDTGTARGGERLYQFTHRTFLEFFTGGHMVRIYPTASDLLKVLLPRIRVREWDVVAQLGVQLLHKQVEGAGDELLAALVHASRGSGKSERRNMLSFAARTLEFIVPRPSVTRQITTECLEVSLAFVKGGESEQDPVRNVLGSGPGLVGDLLGAGDETRPVVTDTLEKWFVERIRGTDATDRRLAMELGLNLGWCVSERVQHGRAASFRYWSDVGKRVMEACLDLVLEECRGDSDICSAAVRSECIPIKQLIDWHGIEALWRPFRYVAFPRLRPWSIAEHLVTQGFGARADMAGDGSGLQYVAELLLAVEPPWVKRLAAKGGSLDQLEFAFRHDLLDWGPGESDPSELFAAIALVGCMLEDPGSRQLAWLRKVTGQSEGTSRSIAVIVLARHGIVTAKEGSEEIARCSFTEAQGDLLSKWIDGRVSFTGRS